MEAPEVEALEANALTRSPATGQLVSCFRDRLLIRLLFRNGVRVSEVVAIGVDDIDLDRAEVRVLHLKERVQLYCRECGGRLARSHPTPEEAAAELLAYLQQKGKVQAGGQAVAELLAGDAEDEPGGGGKIEGDAP